MIRKNLTGVVLCLPLAAVLFTPASCNDSKKNTNSNAATTQSQNNNTVAKEQGRMKGLWGGQGVSMEVTDSGATLNFDCAHGRISEAIVPNGNKFVVKGFFSREHPGPVRAEEESDGQAATYSGAIDEQTLTLTIKLAGSNETVGTFTLAYGKNGRIRKCL